jgi:hypothetical protein
LSQPPPQTTKGRWSSRSQAVFGAYPDLWASKAAAGRSKDYEFCTALGDAGLVDETVCRQRIDSFAGVYAIQANQVLTRSFSRRPPPSSRPELITREYTLEEINQGSEERHELERLHA